MTGVIDTKYFSRCGEWRRRRLDVPLLDLHQLVHFLLPVLASLNEAFLNSRIFH